MTVSIIIAVKTWQRHLEECVTKCLKLDFSDFEIIILPDAEMGTVPALANMLSTKGTVPIKVIPTGPVSPARKRDIALEYARGEILAFLDDDAYPAEGWLNATVENFKDPEVAAIGGPAVTPEGDNLLQRASGMIYSSFLVSAGFVYRYLPQGRRGVGDYPSCNFLVRKSVMQQLGGFNTNFWPGEDTKFCLDITKKIGKKIIYDPRVLVYHHRRPLFKAHLNQVANYGLHRGYFVKKYPQTSAKLSYFMPSLFLAALIGGGLLSLFMMPLRIPYLISVSLYLLLVFIFSISKELPLIPLVFSGIILTHVLYGFCFLKGLLSPRLKEE